MVVTHLPSIVDRTLKSRAWPLDAATRTAMERRFDHDFSGVRVHADAQAARSAEAMHARAYTVGRSIVFGNGAYAPHSQNGRRLIAHELTHVVQNDCWPTRAAPKVASAGNAAEREADDVSRRVAGRGEVRVAARPAGLLQRDALGAREESADESAEPAAASDSKTFADEELLNYLNGINRRRRIRLGSRSDDKARAVVQRWKSGAAGFTILTVPVRILLIREMAAGYLSLEDQAAIVDLLVEAIPLERARIMPAVGIDGMKTRFDGEQRQRLDALFDKQEMESLAPNADWTVTETRKLNARHGDGGLLQRVLSAGFQIFRVAAAIDTWKYFSDGREEDEEVAGFEGNTDHEETPKRIRLVSNMTDESAARALYHECDHALSPEPVTDPEYLDAEVHARVKGEEFGDRHGLPQYEKRYRSRRGKPRIWSITRDVKKSSHYNPTDRKRVDRRYTGEELTSGWED